MYADKFEYRIIVWPFVLSALETLVTVRYRIIIIIIIIINQQFLTRRNMEHHTHYKGANCQCKAKYSDAFSCQLQLNK